MNYKIFLAVLVLGITVIGCKSSKVAVTNYKANAEQLELDGNFNEAVIAWKSYFEQSDPSLIDPGIYARAAKNAHKVGMDNQSIEWFDLASDKNYADREMYSALAEIYRSRDNLSKELLALEFYVKSFNAENANINQRLFEIYFDINRNEKALEAWKGIDTDSLQNESLLDKYFQINKKMDNNEVTDSVSLVLLDINPNHVKALEWNATKYYWKAENHYQSEMKKYEENKTGLQYVFLKNELKNVTVYFKKALTYFDKLWELDSGKKYASYLSNIYVRLDNEQKAKYYRSFLD